MALGVTLTYQEPDGEIQCVVCVPPRFTIGRGSHNDLPLDDRHLSRRHAVIEISQDSACLFDRESRNGVLVNNQRVNLVTRLQDGDEIALGIRRLKVHIAYVPDELSPDDKQLSATADGVADGSLPFTPQQTPIPVDLLADTAEPQKNVLLPVPVVSAPAPSLSVPSPSVPAPPAPLVTELPAPPPLITELPAPTPSAVMPPAVAPPALAEIPAAPLVAAHAEAPPSPVQPPARIPASHLLLLLLLGFLFLVVVVLGVLAFLKWRGQTAPEEDRAATTRTASDHKITAPSALPEANLPAATPWPEEAPPPASAVTPEVAAPTAPATAPDATELEADARSVMQQMSRDPRAYNFPADALNDINREVETVKNMPGLRAGLQDLRQNSAALARAARERGVEPGFCLYSGLAEALDGGSASAQARTLLPKLSTLQTTFGSDEADDALIILAAYRSDGVGGARSHPLLAKLRNVANRPLEQRNVWYLKKQGVLSEGAYRFVVRVLAVGVIARQPTRHGLTAEALTF